MSGCCRFVAGDGYHGFMCSGDPDLRLLKAMSEQQEAEAEYARYLDEPINIASWPCDECGRSLHEDEPGVLSCICGERYRIRESLGGE